MLYFTALTFGLLSSLHCIGMCGPLALALPGVPGTGVGYWLGRVLYHAGRATTYAALGAVFGMLGLGAGLAGYQQQLSIAAGVVMLILLLLYSTTGRTLPGIQGLNKLTQRMLGHLLGSKTTPATLYGIGLVNGLLPCGVVYVALAGAVATGTVWGGAAYMALFGLGTAPLLFAFTVLGGKLSHLRQWNPLLRYAGVVVALLLIVRGMDLGIPYISPKLQPETGLPACCRVKQATPAAQTSQCH